MKILTTIALILFSSFHTFSQMNAYWPKEFAFDNYLITIYAPTPERYENNQLDARAAFTIAESNYLPVFGAMWFTCTVSADLEGNKVEFNNIKLKNAAFQDARGENLLKLKAIVEAQALRWSFNNDLTFFNNQISVIRINNEMSEELQNNPPKIFYSKTPAALIFIDGEPVMQNTAESQLYQIVVNSPHFIVFSKSSNVYYFNAGGYWFETRDLKSTWNAIQIPPQQIVRLFDRTQRLNAASDQPIKTDTKMRPRLIVVNEPSELIQTNGDPEIKQIRGTLFSIPNSDDEILYEADADAYFILISGRWYRSKKLDAGKWTFVMPDKLPKIFKEIPASPDYASLRLSVAGTPEANSAALDNTIPQTAFVDRKNATMKIEYDGEPQFEVISGTSLSYAVNTAGSVIRDADQNFYAVDEAIWFTSKSATGPWVVADHFPADVNRIPPSYPVFNLKFVQIYGADELVVYAGYTAGYTGVFLYRGVLFFGTGYKYKPWYGKTYISRPSTYGFGAKKKTTSQSNIAFYGMAGPPMMMGPRGFMGGFSPMAVSNYNWMAYDSYINQGRSATVNHDIPQEIPIDMANIYKNRRSGILRSETVRRNDPLKPVVVNEGQSLGMQLYVDKSGNLFRVDEKGNWFLRKDNQWRPSSKPVE